MHTYLIALIWAVIAYVAYSFIVSFIANRRYAAEAKRLGCEPAPVQYNDLPYGIDRVQEALRADKSQRFADMILNRYAKMNDKTHTYRYLGVEGIMTADPKNVQAILATQFHDFDLGELRRGTFWPLLGSGIFTADGKQWEHSRAMLRPQFARDQVADLNLEEQHVQNLMRALPVGQNGWTDEVDLQVLFFRYTLDSACEFLFGESVNSQINGLPENTFATSTKGAGPDGMEFAWAFDVAQQWLARRIRFMDKYWLCTGPEFWKANKMCHDFIDCFVQAALNKNPKEAELEKGKSLNTKEKYVFLDALTAETRDPIELRTQLLNILLAGRDTTASFLGYIFYTLVRHPDTFHKLRQTVIADFGTYEASAELTYVSLKNCQYLQHVLNEVLRLNSVVPVNSRRATRDTTLPRGGGPDGMSKIFVKKGQQVDYSVHLMHRRKALWGDDAEEFKPERWTGRKPGWEYLPFNGGPRICLGQQLALTNASYVTVRLLQRFQAMENLDPDPVARHHLSLTSCSGTGVKVRLHEAKA
ncbi:hypothetical protein MMC19_006304 [Ptychographa xylographoides]|nr:hypothetical protein [Ptychographa xylographoides]